MAEPLSDARFAEIRERHQNAIEEYGEAEALDTTVAQDRADLLAEVERLRSLLSHAHQVMRNAAGRTRHDEAVYLLNKYLVKEAPGGSS